MPYIHVVHFFSDQPPEEEGHAFISLMAMECVATMITHSDDYS